MESKVCKDCGIDKPLIEYHDKKGAKDGKMGICKPCNVLRTKAWRAANPEKSKASSKKWHDNNKEATAASSKRWMQNNKAKKNAINAAYRSAKLKATPPWLNEVQLKRIEFRYYKAEKLEAETGIKHHVDHIIPLQGENVCGLHVPWNLEVIPAIDNLVKSNKFISGEEN